MDNTGAMGGAGGTGAMGGAGSAGAMGGAGSAGGARQLKPNKRLAGIMKNWELYLLLLPPLAYFIIFCYWPMYGVVLAFKNFRIADGIMGSPWVGLKHFQTFFKSIYFERVIKNTVGISAYSLIAGFPIPIILALMMNELRSKWFKKTVQTISYAPYFISQVVMVGMIIIFFSPFDDGLVNKVVQLFGHAPIPFMTDPRYFHSIYVWTGVWQSAGWGTVIYMAVLSNVDAQLIEAAIIDGANKLQRILYINIPCILPTVVLLFILSAGGIMSVGFEKIFLMQNALNMDASDVISSYVYRVGLQQIKYDFGTAIGLFNSVINLIILVIVNEIAKRVNETSLW